MQSIWLLVKGLIIGIANIIPGVSGGTMAVVLGVYEPLTRIAGHFIATMRDKTLRSKSLAFIIPLGIGMILGIIGFAHLIDWLFQHYPAATQFFFIGLILGSLPLMLKLGNFSKINISLISGLITGIAIMATFALASKYWGQVSADVANADLLTKLHRPLYFAWLVICGFLAAMAMVVPGISGSALLLMLGEYNHILSFINTLTGKGDLPFFSAGIALVSVMLGVAIGIVGCARLMSWALAQHKTFTFALVTGLMIVSIYAIWPANLLLAPMMRLGYIACIASGITVAYLLGER